MIYQYMLQHKQLYTQTGRVDEWKTRKKTKCAFCVSIVAIVIIISQAHVQNARSFLRLHLFLTKNSYIDFLLLHIFFLGFPCLEDFMQRAHRLYGQLEIFIIGETPHLAFPQRLRITSNNQQFCQNSLPTPLPVSYGNIEKPRIMHT